MEYLFEFGGWVRKWDDGVDDGQRLVVWEGEFRRQVFVGWVRV